MTTKTPWLVLGTLVGVLALSPTSSSAENTSGVNVPSAPSFKKSNAAAYGKQIAEYVDAYNTGLKDSYSKSTITNISASGEKMASKTTQLSLEKSNGNMGLIRYQSPASVAGVAMLTHENHKATDESWLYLPSNRRVRRISGANRTSSFQGTEFTYEDLSSLVPSRYKWKFVKESKGKDGAILQIEGVPTDKNSGYSKLRYHINTKMWRATKIEYYDKGGRLLKNLAVSKWKLYHGRFWRAHKFEMHNKQTQKRSTFEASTQFLSIDKYKKKDGSPREGLKESAFTKRALETR